nr:hypothetical protein REQ54_04720 [Rhizobium sp. Q54]
MFSCCAEAVYLSLKSLLMPRKTVFRSDPPSEEEYGTHMPIVALVGFALCYGNSEGVCTDGKIDNDFNHLLQRLG